MIAVVELYILALFHYTFLGITKIGQDIFRLCIRNSFVKMRLESVHFIHSLN